MLCATVPLSAGCFTDIETGLASASDTTSSSGDTEPSGDAESSISSEGTADEPEDASSTGASSDGSASTGDSVELARVRVVQATPGIAPVDAYFVGDDEPFAEDLAFGDASDWLELSVGFAEIELRPAGDPSDSASLGVSELFELDVDDRLTLVVASQGPSSPGAELRVIPVVDDWANELAGRARVRLIHASPDAPTLRVSDLGADPIQVERYATSDSDGAPLDIAGGVTLNIADASGDALTSFTTPPLIQGDEILVIATGEIERLAREPTGFQLVTVGRDGPLGQIRQDPELFILHGARDADNLEVCIGTDEIAANFFYAEMQSTRLSPGNYSLRLFDYPAGCTGSALNDAGNSTGSLRAGERYLLLVTGERTPDPEEPSIQVATFVDDFTLDDDANASIRFVHGASFEQIYVGGITDGSIEAENVYTVPIAWTAQSTEQALPQSDYLLGIANAVGTPPPPYTPLVSFDYSASPGARQWGIVSGDPIPDDAGDGLIQLMLVSTRPSPWTVDLVDINVDEPPPLVAP